MITLIENATELADFEQNNIYIVKALSNILTYGNENCLMTWRQDNHILFQKLDDSAIIFADDNADYVELLHFIKTVGAREIFTSREVAQRLHFKIISSGIIMHKSSYTSPVSSGFKPPPFPEYTKIYELLTKCKFTLPPKDYFMSDLAFRVKKGTARIYADSDYKCVALTAFETDKSAVISAVAVAPSSRNHGNGSGVLSTLCASLMFEDKEIYLYRKKGKNERFYLKNGFENSGEFVNCIQE